jgi:glycosyltransferase involved in cell wall biosynthesis
VRIVQLNLAYERACESPSDLLERYHTLTGWSRALRAAGAEVDVVQRYSQTSVLSIDGTRYWFVADAHSALLRPWEVPQTAVTQVAKGKPDIVHVNGLMFPATIEALRRTLGDSCVIVLQDHSGIVPRFAPLWRAVAARRWRRAFATADACSFTTRELAARWRHVGLSGSMKILEIPEASTTLSPSTSDNGRVRLAGSPVILWVGRLDANKDPLTVLDAMARSADDLPSARLWMVTPGGALEAAVAARVSASAVLRARVSLQGPVPHHEMTRYYSAADVFVSGSHHEGSGYALIESLACGVTPCVTDIPAFRALVDECGVLWSAGDAAACAAALRAAARMVSSAQRQQVRRHFTARLSWQAIAHLTLHAYADLLSHRRARA